VTASATPAAEQSAPGRNNIYIAFVPWVLFAVISRHDTLQVATVVALAAALFIAAPGVLAGRPKQLEVGAVVAFALFTLLAFVADPGTDDFVVRYARAIAAALLAGIALLSLLSTPFTEQYARESVPEQFWSSPRFKQVNRSLTLMWAGVFTVMVPSHVLAGAIDTQRANTLFNWVIPVALIVWAVKRTERLSQPPAQ
jgi:hypothetical protein